MSNKVFEKVAIGRKKRSAFDLSHEQKLTARFGFLYPTLVEEILPGDEYKVRTESMIRLAPMLAPVMHRVNVYMHYFFVPNRLIWNQWEDFITGGREGESAPSMPVYNLEDLNGSSDFRDRCANYMGLPSDDDKQILVSQLPFRAYNLIWNEYYRDQNLQAPQDIHNLPWSVARRIRLRAWEKDYFTSALPWAQRGPSVNIPVSSVEADINYHANTIVKDGSTGDLINRTEHGTYVNIPGDPPDVVGRLQTSLTADGGRNANLRIENIDSIEVDGLDVDIRELRRASRLQEWLEKQARGGSRYIETILSHFGVRGKDSRLQRPEYLGGGKQPVVISEVLNTTGTANAPQGDMAGHGISVGETMSFSRSFDEHGYLIGIMSILPRAAYQQGIPRMWSRKDKFDFYWPEFAHIGEQEIKNKELYLDAAPAEWEKTFGYQQRYAEYKYKSSTVHGDFRDSLAFWHAGRIFGSPPALNNTFVNMGYEQGAIAERIFDAGNTADYLWIQLYHDIKARRPIPFFSNPNL